MNYTKEITNVIKKFKPLEIINSKKVYQENFSNIPEGTYYKVIERLFKAKKIERVAKGMYCVPKKTEFGTIIDCSENIINKYTQNNSGMFVNYKMYFENNLTTQVPKHIHIFSNNVDFETRSFNNITILKKNIEFNKKNKAVITIMEVLENYHKIEEFNINNFVKMYCDYLKQYEEKAVIEVIEKIKYKKRTIAFFKEILDVNKKENNLNKYLSTLSKYRIPYEEIQSFFVFE